MLVQNEKLTSEKSKRKTETHYYRLESYKSAIADKEKERRLEHQECVICFYVASKIGGAAMTDSNCGICDEITTYGSTATDVICKKCAKKNKLCVYCGGDLETRVGRRVWF